ncbi:MAG: hypothetical protein GTO45_00535 [Candidatus Aminicenantes bacterium]|nr:hypothetical protein [Candidatus Aminicenantes bacterium]NIM77249.1 hypothetical protein [Candidatus Aminicenantes bacterium]NIN16550.1 hypothetical protein [Candidatus Aminicenantes bacterium]NIN40408.1 hypothetical protein [Candidatus Aminicenantes bacterium]NIN83228.1 hypothetical protein [Candidatus Aminicenantes bacterium]
MGKSKEMKLTIEVLSGDSSDAAVIAEELERELGEAAKVQLTAKKDTEISTRDGDLGLILQVITVTLFASQTIIMLASHLKNIKKKRKDTLITITDPQTGRKVQISENDPLEKVEKEIQKVLKKKRKEKILTTQIIPELEIHERGGVVAVIVGIDGYKDLKPLQCAVNDAVLLAETLENLWSDRRTIIKTLVWPSINKTRAKQQEHTWGIELPMDAHEVNRESILSEVQRCAGLAGESDTFVFYFSGHGELTDEEPVLLTVSDAKTAKGIEKIKISELQEAAAGCASRKKVMILDGCQSSTTKDKPAEEYKDLKELTRGWSIFLSSSPGEVSLEDQYFGNSRDDYLQQGIFTASLVEGLKGEAGGSQGSVSLAELAYFVGKRVPIEFQERITALLSEKGAPINTRGIGSFSQNPVLLTEAVALDGLYKVTMAPRIFLPFQRARRMLPSKDFLKFWFKFILRKWPIQFPHKMIFRIGGALLYAAVMLLTFLFHFTKSMDQPMMIFLGGVGVGSAFIWWITLPFAVAANEDRWHSGGFVTSIFYLLWHCVVALGFTWMGGIDKVSSSGTNQLIYLVSDLFFILVAVVICGCNTSQTIIALAETVRNDERRDIRQAIRAFQQFKATMLGVDLYNYIAIVSIRPDLYLYILIISTAIIGFNIYQIMIPANVMTLGLWVFLGRNTVALMLVTWLVFWYYAAFKFLQREVYKR